MARCQICNDFEIGQGAILPFNTWVALALSSPCRYCHLLVDAINALDAEFLSEEYQKTQLERSDIESSVSLKVDIDDKGRIHVHSNRNGWYRVEISLQFFRSARHDPQDCAIGTFLLPSRDEIAQVPGDPGMWTFLRSSLRTCLTEHSPCRNAQDPTWFPERLLSLQRSGNEKPVARLIETRHHRPQSAYIALSHCWGTERFIRTTSENIQSHRDMVESSSLPRTFQDAIKVAQELDVHYIWIDSLCIIQNDEDDWARHAEQMDRIYENALFVVAAVSSSASSEPFLGPEVPTKRPSYSAVDLDYVGKDGSPKVAVKVRRLSPFLSAERVQGVQGPLENRAWAMQERYCAVRIISFAQEEAKWQCKVGTSCECYGRMRSRESSGWQPPEQEDLGDEGAIIYQKWRDVVKAYAARNLTYDTDRLPALAGIASRFHSLLQSNYIAGLWEVKLPFNLGWYRRNATDDDSSAPVIPPSMNNDVPTWSWASIFWTCEWLWEYSSRLLYGTEKHPGFRLESKVDVVQVNCTPRATNAFGSLESGSFIELRGRVVPAVMESDAYGHASVQRDGFNPQMVVLDCRTSPIIEPNGTQEYDLGTMRRVSARGHVKLAVADVENATSELEQNTSTFNRGKVVCLLLYTGTCQGKSQACVLILGKVSDTDGTTYQRLGLGCGRLEGRPWRLHGVRKSWELSQGREDLEQWEEWERWFADAELDVVKIV